MTETIDSANAAASSLFLGHNGEWWDFWLILSLVGVALAAIAAGVTTTGSIVSHKREAAVAEEALDRYKLNTSKEISEAQARAAEAQLALAKFRSPRGLTREQQDKLITEMRPFAGSPITFGVFQDPESTAFMEQLSTALLSAGWIEQDWKSGGDIVWTRSPPHPVAGFVYVIGVYVQADGPRHGSDFGPIVIKLAKLLSDFGIEAKSEVGRMAENTNNDAIKILIGQKPR